MSSYRREDERMTLINWPTEDEDWRDSREGGQYAYFVIPAEDNHYPPRSAGGCHVDVAATLTHYEVVLNHDELWPKWEDYKGTPPDSDACSAIVFAGSSDLSLYSQRHGRYWTAAADDLTPRGRAIYDSLADAFGVEPWIVTFLDT